MPSTAEAAARRGENEAARGEGQALSPAAGRRRRWSGRDVLLLLVLLASGLGSRLAKLGDWSLSGDEYYSLLNARGMRYEDLGEILFGKGSPTHPGLRAYPVHYLLTRVGMDLLRPRRGRFRLEGNAAFVLRLPAALAGGVAPAALWLAARSIVGGPAAAFAALLVLFSPWQLYHAQSARFYSLVFLLTGLVVLGFYRALREDRPGLAAACVVGLAIAVLTHTTAAFEGITVAIFAGLMSLVPRLRGPGGMPRRALLVLGGVALAGAVAVVPRVLEAIATRNAIGVTAAAYSTAHLTGSIVLNLGPAACLLAFFGLPILWGRNRAAAVFLGLAALVPTVLLVILGWFFDVRQDYMFASAGFVYLLAGVCLAEALATQRRAILAALVAFALATPLPSLVSHYSDGNRHDIRAAGAYLAEHTKGAGFFLGEQHALLKAYSGIGWIEESPPDATLLRQCERMADKGQVPVYFVLHYARNGRLIDGTPELEAFVAHDCVLEKEIRAPRWDFHDNVIRIYRAGPEPLR